MVNEALVPIFTASSTSGEVGGALLLRLLTASEADQLAKLRLP
ncbi:MAG: hypothetical protein OXP75_18245 [Rhodospirillales bacterium]|nr:hypothetical protein [Rhodospirillales bacterium]